MYELGGTGTRNDFIATPVVYDGKVYIGVGQDPEHSTGIANFFCIAPKKARRAISPRRWIAAKRDKDGKIDREAEPELLRGLALRRVEEAASTPRATSSSAAPCRTACVVDDILYISELAGYLHCLDAKTGKHFWQYDTKAAIWGSPYYVDGKILLATEPATCSSSSTSKNAGGDRRASPPA